MSCDRFLDFEIEISIKEVTLDNLKEEGDKEFTIELNFLGNIIKKVQNDELSDNTLAITEGFQKVALHFKLTNLSGNSKDDFTFNALGEPLIGELNNYVSILLLKKIYSELCKKWKE